MTRSLVVRRVPGGLPPESEASLQRKVVQLLRLNGWLLFHPWLSLHSTVGFPDITAVRDGRQLSLELKREGAPLTERQQVWLDALAAVPGVTAIVVRPDDWDQLCELVK